MPPPDIKMDANGVRQTAQNLRADADKAKNTIGTLFDSGNEAAGAHPGWNSAAALRECGHTWWKELTTLVDQTAWTAWNIDQSAKTNTAKDNEARERLGTVLGGLTSS
ncbi:hypothetical protein EV193_103144 [Herbihabitans rhizosphaerae]|uniref:Excreted virulence factor EspC (Type VII ESX diderm) n=1 Tax=Herbihabitans rhizosphaerae TaxID=1872711 RepID=A0A4Q7KX16_9PSEU|nr:hypothetical protein [Herbihabitans rhizosphaerae]RZS40830.1 hypothetical protein EV193_103144 [Herbihabitans rhizosphaerae]